MLLSNIKPYFEIDGMNELGIGAKYQKKKGIKVYAASRLSFFPN